MIPTNASASQGIKVETMSVVPRKDKEKNQFLCGKWGWILAALGILTLLTIALLFGLGIIGGTPGNTKVGKGSETPNNPFGEGKNNTNDSNLSKDTKNNNNQGDNSKLNGKNGGSNTNQ